MWRNVIQVNSIGDDLPLGGVCSARVLWLASNDNVAAARRLSRPISNELKQSTGVIQFVQTSGVDSQLPELTGHTTVMLSPAE